MGIFNRTDYVEIGRTAPAETLTAVFGNFSRRKQDKLIKGAIETFNGGHPENIQALLAQPDMTLATAKYVLREIIKENDDKAAAINSAFKITPEGFKKRVLDSVLADVIDNESVPEESLVAALLKCGADANAVHDGFAGSLLAWVAFFNHPAPVGKLLVDAGASFESALNRAYFKDYTIERIKRLENYKETLQKRLDETVKSEAQATTLQLQQEVRELRKEIELLPARIVEALKAAERQPRPGFAA